MSEKKNIKQPASEQQAESRKTAVIYLGPAITGVAMPGTVYRNGLTPQLSEAVKEVPSLKKLLVPVECAQKVRKDLKDPHSAAGICYQDAVEYAKKGAKG